MDTEPGRVLLAELRDSPLSVDEVLAAVVGPRTGGTAVFVGTVRDHDADRPVTALAYSAHPSAVDRLREVVGGVAERSPGVRLGALHRVGDLAVGDLAVVVVAAAPHRAEAFAAARELIEEIKHEVPIWKHQRFADGTQEWVSAAG